MVKDAELNAADDKKKLELVQARNQAEAMVHSVKKSLAEYGDKLDAGEKEKIEAAHQGRGGSPQGRRQGRHRSQDRRPDDGQPEARREDVRRHAGGAGGSRRGGAGGGAGGERAKAPAKPADDNVVDAEVKEVKK